MITVTIQEADGERSWGTHLFHVLPSRGDHIDLYADGENPLLAKVEEIRHGEIDPRTGAYDICLYVTEIKIF